MKRLVLIALLASACSSTPTSLPIEVPHFAADDPQVGQGGFVGKTLRLREKVGETEYILMAFRVGETVTLGAMLEGEFDGDVRFEVGDATLTLPFPEESPGRESEAQVKSAPKGIGAIIGERASFRGIRWINVELDATAWFPHAGIPVRLAFLPYDGESRVLPDENAVYRVDFAQQ